MKNSQKGFVVLLLIALIAVLVIGGGIYIFSIKKSEAPVLPDAQTQTSDNGQGGNQINIPSSGTNIDTKKLSLHKSESCGFEISFPSQFVNNDNPLNPNPKLCSDIVSYGKQINALSLKSRADCNIDGAGESGVGCNFFEIVVAGNKIMAEGIGTTKESIIVDKIFAEKLTILDGGVGQILIQFEKNKQWYRYTHTFSPSDVKEAKKLSDSIISTFKFTK